MWTICVNIKSMSPLDRGCLTLRKIYQVTRIQKTVDMVGVIDNSGKEKLYFSNRFLKPMGFLQIKIKEVQLKKEKEWIEKNC